MDKLAALKDLNTLLKREKIAAEVYGKFVSVSEDKGIQNEFQKIQLTHREHVDILAERIKALGGKPEYNTGVTGVFANAVLTLGKRNNRDPVELLKTAYDGEDKGIASAEKIARQELDEESKHIINNILSEDHCHLKSLLTMIEEYGYKH